VKIRRPNSEGRKLLALFLLLAVRPVFAAATNASDADAIPPLRPPHAEIPPTLWEQYGLWVIVFGVLLLALVGAAVWLLTRPKAPVILPAHVQARQALEPLFRQPEDGALLSRVSQVLRRYVAAAFNLPPGELTTAEFCSVIRGHAQIGQALSAALTEFLRLCDHDKFAQPAPVPPLGAASRALKLIDQAEQRRLAMLQPAVQPPANSPATAPMAGASK
jgi:hypothetical protein